MNNAELQAYLEEHSHIIDTFRDKGLAYQNEKNQKRQPAKRWNENKVDRAVDKTVAEFIANIQVKLAFNIRGEHANAYQTWLTFIEQNEVVEALAASVNEMTFE
ncbi:hypothetical protein [Latilactobacillus fragifolii]|uniref:hypothetical protein n=1 Tax=Latilactobacillus fragifolii TaxID=2814244 RepID=UPI001ABB9D62|nr:hypothetical protein [Latilactobacillus fragifolii]